MTNKFNATSELRFLNELAENYQDQSPYSEIKKDIIINLICKHLAPEATKSGLQLGCANGYETQRLAERLRQLVVVDGSSEFIGRLKVSNQQGNVNFVFSLFEDLVAGVQGEKFDFIFCSYILEHVYDANHILENMRQLLKPDGLIFIVVPNFNGLSRRIAQKMGIVEDLRNLTENDLRHGHRRVYDRQSLLQAVGAAGLHVRQLRGVIFKILADFQLNQLLASDFLQRAHIEALQKLAEEEGNLDFSDSMFLVASLSGA